MVTFDNIRDQRLHGRPLRQSDETAIRVFFVGVKFNKG